MSDKTKSVEAKLKEREVHQINVIRTFFTARERRKRAHKSNLRDEESGSFL